MIFEGGETVKVNSLTYYYKDQVKPVLDKLCIEFESGKLNVIIGPNGAGKTTLLDIISGVISTNQFKSPFSEKDIVYQLQGIPLPAAMKGKDVIRVIFNCDSEFPFIERIKLFEQSLNSRERELFNKLWDRKIGHMSVGERRWLLIRSICQLERELYIFDEPTSGIDPDARLFILESIDNLVKKGKLVVMTTHILYELEYIDCKLYFLHRGNILYAGDYISFLNKYNTQNPDVAFQLFLNGDGDA